MKYMSKLDTVSQALRKVGVRGVAWWNTGSVDYGAADNQADAMWDAMSAFAGPRMPTLPLPAMVERR
jgi:hypothetical protein